MTRTCENCIYYASFSTKHGACHANPPENLLSYIVANTQQRKEFHYRSGYPATCATDIACSKYVPKDNLVNVVATFGADKVGIGKMLYDNFEDIEKPKTPLQEAKEFAKDILSD